METMETRSAKVMNYPANSAKNIITALLKPTDITLNGSQPWDIQVHNPAFYDRVVKDGSLGLGESYMDHWWDCERLDILFYKILGAQLADKLDIPWHFKAKQLLARFINLQSKSRAKIVANHHYDLGNDLFVRMLDKQMIYSCAYYKDAVTLDAAQTAKLKLICDKLQLQPGMRLLDIGCGWGGLAAYAAQHYDVEVVGITISQEQYEYAKTYNKNAAIDFRLQDYRDVDGLFDRVVSVGMFEHVGFMNYAEFMRVSARCLKDDGLFLLHTIGGNQVSTFADEWITKYIFPNGMLPTAAQIINTSEKHFILEDWHNFGAHYDKTLMAWYENFNRGWQELSARYNERFYRMWTYYLLACAGAFRARSMQLWQIVFSKHGVLGGYASLR